MILADVGFTCSDARSKLFEGFLERTVIEIRASVCDIYIRKIGASKDCICI